jgi:hypothetical protein
MKISSLVLASSLSTSTTVESLDLLDRNSQVLHLYIVVFIDINLLAIDTKSVVKHGNLVGGEGALYARSKKLLIVNLNIIVAKTFKYSSERLRFGIITLLAYNQVELDSLIKELIKGLPRHVVCVLE